MKVRVAYADGVNRIAVVRRDERARAEPGRVPPDLPAARRLIRPRGLRTATRGIRAAVSSPRVESGWASPRATGPQRRRMPAGIERRTQVLLQVGIDGMLEKQIVRIGRSGAGRLA